MGNIRNIIFDLGGVFIELDFFRTDKAFKEFGVLNFHDFFTQHHASPLFADLETGKIGEKEFYNFFREQTAINLTDSQIKEAWNAMLLNFPEERLLWLENIRKKYRIFLFSNTNIIHYDVVQKIYQENSEEKNFNEYFVNAYYSHKLGMRKPDLKSFETIIQRENLNKEETLFIDDSAKNIEAAKQVGLHTILLEPPTTVLDLNL